MRNAYDVFKEHPPRGVEPSFFLNICLSLFRFKDEAGALILKRAYDHLYGEGSYRDSRRWVDGQFWEGPTLAEIRRAMGCSPLPLRRRP